MSSEAFHIRDYHFSNSDALLVDANVWLYLYGPQEPEDWRAKVYSQAPEVDSQSRKHDVRGRAGAVRIR
ncbi:MAG: hypothetical protein WBG50_05560 [Desulfomonilaceae bacterium]